ncbi:MAG: hypothetical protein WC910_08370 [Bacteroidales bacterium]|jgi:hypothetical protein
MTDQGFNTYFNLIDNFTSKFDAIQKRITSVTRDKYVVDFGVSDTSVKKSSEAVKKVMGDFDGLQDAFSQPLHLTVIDQISRHIDSIGKQLDILRAKAIIPVGLSTGAAAAGLAAGALGVAAVGGVAAAGIGLAAQSEEMMIRVNKLIGLTGEEAKNVGADVGKLRIKTGSSESEVAAVYEMAGSSAIGLDKINKGKELEDAGDAAGAAEQYRLAREEISGWAEQVLMAKVAFGTSSEEVAGSMSAIATSFKPAETSLLGFTKSLTSAIDYFADETPGKVTESGLLMAMQTASAGLQKIQPTDEQVSGYAALAASVMSVGKTGDHTGEVLRKVFITMQGDAENIAKAMGMSMKDYQNLLDTDAQKILDLALEKYTTLKGQDAVEFAKLFGDAYGTEMFAAVAGSRDKFDAYMASKGKGGKAYEDASRIGTSFEGAKAGTLSQLSSIKESILVIGKAIGMIFLPTVNLVLTVINKLLGPMALLADRFVQVADSIPGLNLVATVVSVLAMATGARLLAPLLLQTATNLGIMTTATKVFTMYTNITTGAIKAMGTTLVKALAFSLANPIVLVIALAAAVGYLLYKTGYLQKAWDKFKDSAIGKDLIGGVIAGVALVTDAFSKLFSWLDEQWSKGSEGAFGWLLSALDTIASTFGWLFDKLDAAYASGELGEALKIGVMGMFPITLLIKPLEAIVGFVSKLFSGSESIEDITTDAVEWLSSLWDNLSDLPGYISDKIKSWLQTSLDSIPNGIVEWLKKLWDALTSLPSSISSAINGWLPWGDGAEDEGKKSSLSEADREDVIQKAKSSRTGGGYKNFDFGMGSDIWDMALTEAETGIAQKVPNLQNKAEYERLVGWFRGELANKNSGGSGNTTPIGGEIEIKKDQWGNQYRAPVPPEAPQAPETFKNQGSMYVAFGDDGLFDVMNASGMVQRGFASEASAKEYIANQSQYAIGATFKKDGLFAGRVHAPEEIIPQATAQRGAGPIARALDTLYGVTSTGKASSGPSTEVHVHNANDFSGMRVSSDVDIEKLMKEIDRRIESRSISAVHKAMGQRRT